MSAPAPAPAPPAGEAQALEPVEFTEFFCHECQSSVWLPMAAAQPMPRRPPCPLCRGDLQAPEPSSSPDPEPPLAPPGFLSGSEDSDDPMDLDELEELDDIDGMNPAEARLYITRFIYDRLYTVADPEDIAAATAAALSLLEDHLPRRVPPASAASIAALPTVEVSDPDTECSICLEDLPLASAALKLPCSHLYHSCCIVSWLQMHNSCPMCRSRLPVDDAVDVEASPSDPYTTITIRLTARRRVRVNDVPMFAQGQGPVSSSATQLAQAGTTGEGGGGPANSGDTVSSEWPPQPDSDAVMSEARDGDGNGDAFFD